MRVLFVLLSCVLSHVAAPAKDRYFREDHLTGATYLRLAVDGRYTLTSREHMGVFEDESGRWKSAEQTIGFTPDRKGKDAYVATVHTHKTQKFLAFASDEAPSIVISADEIRRRMDEEPKRVPSYVFFEIDEATFKREAGKPYPFRTRKDPVR